jgi:hypothetical protein
MTVATEFGLTSLHSCKGLDHDYCSKIILYCVCTKCSSKLARAN